MNPAEAVLLCRHISHLCPAQRMDPATTPDAWGPVLADLPYEVAKVAADECAKQAPFIAPADVHKMVNRLRRATGAAALARADDDLGEPPAEVTAYLEALRTRDRLRRRYADEAIAARQYARGDLLALEA